MVCQSAPAPMWGLPSALPPSWALHLSPSALRERESQPTGLPSAAGERLPSPHRRFSRWVRSAGHKSRGYHRNHRQHWYQVLQFEQGFTPGIMVSASRLELSICQLAFRPTKSPAPWKGQSTFCDSEQCRRPSSKAETSLRAVDRARSGCIACRNLPLRDSAGLRPASSFNPHEAGALAASGYSVVNLNS